VLAGKGASAARQFFAPGLIFILYLLTNLTVFAHRVFEQKLQFNIARAFTLILLETLAKSASVDATQYCVDFLDTMAEIDAAPFGCSIGRIRLGDVTHAAAGFIVKRPHEIIFRQSLFPEKIFSRSA